jgi:glycosyltransferase involved in cell wall biosynthesis
LALIEELGISNRVYYDNHRTDAAALIAANDVLVLPSLSEARPRVIIEAMCLGRPVVATAVGGVPVMVQHGETGLLVQPDNATELAAALDRLVISPDNRARMGKAGQEFALRFFHPERTVARYVDLYRQLAFG